MFGLLLAVIYLSFVSLGLPDAVLGSAWPIMSGALGTGVSSMGIVTMIISAGTIFSSLQCDRLVQRVGVFRITVCSIACTAVSLLGFALSPSFLILCLWAVPYGLGAGCVDAALNGYVALHFESKYMSWLHCMWGLGAAMGPSIMGVALTGGFGFRAGYVALFCIQVALTLVLLASRRIWQFGQTLHVQGEDAPAAREILTLRQIFAIRGVPQIALAFFCFCAIEQTTGLWASSYLVYYHGVAAEQAAGFTALFYLGITIGRGINGFIAMRCTDTQMIRGGAVIMACGVAVLLLPMGTVAGFVGIALIGLGSSPVYPCIIHATPHNFGAMHAQAITGVQMACAYTGTLCMPALFGVLGKQVGFGLYPIYIGVLLLAMVVLYERLLKTVATPAKKN